MTNEEMILTIEEMKMRIKDLEMLVYGGARPWALSDGVPMPFESEKMNWPIEK